jgi:integrase
VAKINVTETALRRLPAVSRETDHGIGGNLYLRQSPTGRLTWFHRSKSAGRINKRKLGVWPAMSLAAARAEAAKLNTTAMPDNTRTDALADLWFERVIEPTYKVTKNAKVYSERLKRYFGHRNIGTLTTAELVANLTTYGKRHPVAANRCRSTWQMIFQYARECGLLTANPLLGTSNKIAGGRERSRNRVLNDAEILALWKDNHQHAALLRALLLTGCRISELQRARVDHIDGDILHIRENKSDRPHWVFITATLRDQFGDFNGYLFKDRSPTAVQSRLKRSRCGWTPHDLRRTFATRLAGMGVGPQIVEKCLNHVMDGVLAVYNRFDYAEDRIAASKALAAEVLRMCGEQ